MGPHLQTSSQGHPKSMSSTSWTICLPETPQWDPPAERAQTPERPGCRPAALPSRAQHSGDPGGSLRWSLLGPLPPQGDPLPPGAPGELEGA